MTIIINFYGLDSRQSAPHCCNRYSDVTINALAECLNVTYCSADTTHKPTTLLRLSRLPFRYKYFNQVVQSAAELRHTTSIVEPATFCDNINNSKPFPKAEVILQSSRIRRSSSPSESKSPLAKIT